MAVMDNGQEFDFNKDFALWWRVIEEDFTLPVTGVFEIASIKNSGIGEGLDQIQINTRNPNGALFILDHKGGIDMELTHLEVGKRKDIYEPDRVIMRFRDCKLEEWGIDNANHLQHGSSIMYALFNCTIETTDAGLDYFAGGFD